jgi:formylglycine-generating enzyme required for sulfatase activity
MIGQNDYQYDLFIAYTTTDRTWVENYLLPKLGLPSKRVITTQDFRPGAPNVNEFERAVTESRYTVLVFTPNYEKDEWFKLSENLVSYSSVAEQRDRLIPLLLKPCELPLRIHYRVRLDCTDSSNWENELARLRALLAEQDPNLGTQTQREQTAHLSPIPTLSTFTFEVVTLDAMGKVANRCDKKAQYFIESLGGVVELKMVSIPGGKFTMGSPKAEEASQEDERPQHLVTVKPFFMGRYPITQVQWRAIAFLAKIKRELNPDPSCFKGDNLPVERVSWYDALEFCQRLSRETGREYRLPSEAEWEYACRARTSTPFHFGKTVTTDLANYCGQNREIEGILGKGTYGNEPCGVYHQRTTEVACFPANSFGLCDMHGNVWEWCADYDHQNYQSAPLDGNAWITDGNSEYRILRGGSWDYSPHFCRCASRFSENPNILNKEFGFRVVFSSG